MSESLVQYTTARLVPQAPSSLPLVPWRDPHSVAPTDLAAYIAQLEQACIDYPQSAEVRICLGIAHAVNYDVYKSMDALEEARAVDPDNFWAQLKYAELHYRLRALNKAEEETRRAQELAQNPIQLAIARKQMKDIRELKHTCVRNVEWTKPLTKPAIVLSLMVIAVFAVMMWR
jgi:cytochrome c-type biogenesis protein CcmH/NrfG